MKWKNRKVSSKVPKKKTLSILVISLLVITSFVAWTGCIEDEEDPDTLVIAQTSEPADFHPIRFTDVYSDYILMQIYDPILQTAPDGVATAEGRAVAESFEVSDDGLEYTIEIEEGVVFHNGDEVTAEDIKFTLDTLRGATDLDNAPESPRSGDFGSVDSVEIVDDYTVEIHMEEIDGELLLKSGFESTYVLPKDYITENGWDDYEDELIGTGPYELVDYREGEVVELEENENYRLDVNIPNVEFQFYDDESSAVVSIRGGDAHYLRTDDVTNWHMLRDEEDAVIAESYPINAHYHLAMNQQEGMPFADETLRRALAYAIDSEEIIDGLRTDELAEDTRSPLPSTSDGHNPDLPMYEQDIEKAQDLLADAGYPDGIEVELYTSHGDTATEMEILQDQVAEAGFDIELVIQEWGGFLDDVQAGNAPLFYSGWTGGASIHFVMEYYRSDSPFNWFSGFYNNTAFNDKMDEALRQPEPEDRNELFREAQEILVEEDMGTFIMYTRQAPRVWHESIEIPEESKNPYMGAGPQYRVLDWEFVED